MATKRSIVNLSTGHYIKAQRRLIDSLKRYASDCDLFMYQSEGEIKAPRHNLVPYAFKPYAMDLLRQKGYDLILWLDSSVWAVRPLDDIWQIIETKGYYMEEAGHYLGRWTNDRALNNFGITREQAMKIPMYSAGLTGLDLNFQHSKDFLNDWLNFAKDGETFKGDWKDHRHDMSAASFLAWKYGFELEKGGTYCAYVGSNFTKPKDSVIFYLSGIA